MNDFGAIAWGAGFQDGLNPCTFMTCAVFITYGFWLKKKSLRIGRLYFLFILTYAASAFVLNFGPLQGILFHKTFIFITKIVYFILGLGSFILGLLFCKDWFLLHRGYSPENLTFGSHGKKPEVGRSDYFNGLVVGLLTIILSLVLSALATYWPINTYLLLLGNVALLKGQGLMVMPMLLKYVLSSMWPLWFIWAFLSIKKIQPSLLKIVCAAFFFTASSCMIFIFK